MGSGDKGKRCAPTFSLLAFVSTLYFPPSTLYFVFCISTLYSSLSLLCFLVPALCSPILVSTRLPICSSILLIFYYSTLLLVHTSALPLFYSCTLLQFCSSTLPLLCYSTLYFLILLLFHSTTFSAIPPFAYSSNPVC